MLGEDASSEAAELEVLAELFAVMGSCCTSTIEPAVHAMSSNGGGGSCRICAEVREERVEIKAAGALRYSIKVLDSVQWWGSSVFVRLVRTWRQPK